MRPELWMQWRPALRLSRVRLPGMNEAEANVVDVLVANHRHFLAFLERRVGSRAVAEDLLQDAFVRGIDRLPTLRRPEAATAWFYRALRNALVDHYRRQGAESRALAAAALEGAVQADGDDEELHRLACSCIGELVNTLRPEYASAIRRVELEGVAVRDYAGEAGITPNNAAVRLHRARESLRRQVARSCGTCAEHGCEDCTCGGAGPGSG